LIKKTLEKLRSLSQKPALRQGGLVLLDQSFLSIATFATGAMLARAITKDQYSIYVLGLSLILFLQGFARSLVNVPFTIYAPRLGDSERNIYQGSAFVHTLVVCGVVAIAMYTGYLMGARSLDHGATGFIATFPLLAFATGSFILREFTRGTLLARLQIRSGVGVNMLATAGQLMLTGSLFGLHRLTIEYAFQVMALTSLLAAAKMLWSHRSEMQIVRRRIWADFLRSFKTGKWTVLELFAYFGASQAYPWLLLYLLDPGSVAAFGVCGALAALVGPFLRGASGYIHPRMVHGYKDSSARNLRRLVWLSSLVLTIPYGAWLIIGSVFGEELLTLFYGRNYSAYAGLTTLLLIRATIEGLSTPLSNALQTMERADAVTVGLVIGAIITLSLGPFLILQMGLNGAGIAAAASSAASAFWKWKTFRNVVRV
jgi:O-antigen/teichoic acid export membrane protein